MSEVITFGNRLRSRALALAPALAVAAVAACGSDQDDKETSQLCTSPIAESDIYPGDPNADPDNRKTWKTGIEVTTALHAQAQGLVFGYRAPHAPKWTKSELVEFDRAKEVGLLIGDSDVIFMAQTVGMAGSSACDYPPESAFSPAQPLDGFLSKDVTLPNW